MDDANDEAFAAPKGGTGDDDNGGLRVVQRLEVGAQAPGRDRRVKLGLHEDPATDEVQAAGEAQRRAHLGGDLGRSGDDGARELVLHV